MRLTRSSTALLVACVLGLWPGVAAGAGPGNGARSSTATGAAQRAKLDDPIPAAIRPGHIDIGLRTIATGFVSPVGGTSAPGIASRLFIADQIGKIWSVDIRDRIGHRTLMADLTDLVVELGNVVPGTAYDERGLLGIAFHPDYQENGLVYTYLTEPWGRPADFSTQPNKRRNCDAWLPFEPRPCQNVVAEWRVRDPRDPDTTIDRSSERELLRIDKPQFNHNGGALAFGADGLLYISVGDGGFANDKAPGHVPGGNAQSLAPGNVLGKILRIDPRRHDSTNHHYGIPRDNPFVGRPGADEIFAYGFRNPYRMSFDPISGLLYVADVGQGDVEEIDIVKSGGNYGWRVKEGTFRFHAPAGFDSEGGFVSANTPHRPRGLIDPIAEYDHTAPTGDEEQGEAVVGGFVYRGSDIPALAGKYVFGDYSREFGTPDGRLFYLCESPDVTHRVCDLVTEPGIAVFGFVRDAGGELYLLGNHTGVNSGHGGVVKTLTPRA